MLVHTHKKNLIGQYSLMREQDKPMIVIMSWLPPHLRRLRELQNPRRSMRTSYILRPLMGSKSRGFTVSVLVPRPTSPLLCRPQQAISNGATDRSYVRRFAMSCTPSGAVRCTHLLTPR